MARIFISHSSKDNAEAIALARWLEAEGWDDFFLDLHPERGIVAGARWEKALHDAAHRCQAVVFLVSRQWLASEWCLRELQLAHRLDKHIFGVLIDEVDIASVPAKLKDHWQLVDLAGGRDHGAPVAVDLPDGGVRHVTFSQSGLGRLKAGLVRAEIDARFFAWPPPNDPERPPWRGMLPLEAEDAGIFHGREAPIIEVLDRLRGLREAAPPRLLVILGASGAGKSSFLRAGLMARLARDDRTFLALPVVRPGRAVLWGEDGLAKALHAALDRQGIGLGPGAVASAVGEGAPAVLALLRELAERTRAPALDGEEAPEPPTLVLALDQGEELFAADGRVEAERFMALLAGVLRAEVPKLIVLAAIRSDSYERLQIAPELEGLRQRAFSLPPLPHGAYQQVIEGPAERLKGTPRELRIEPALTARLLADVGEGGARDALPLLAFTLSQLYRGRTRAGAMALADYEAMGGIGGAIGAAVERALEAAARDPALPREREAQLALLRRAMIPWLAGIDPETGTPRRKEAKLSEIPEEARPLVRHLVTERLLSTDRAYSGDDRDGAQAAAGAATVEPAHEALLRQWSLLKGWLEEDAGRLAALEGVRRATRDWLANARDAAWLSHRAGRLEDAEQLAERPDLAARLDEDDRAYLAACRKAENDARDRELAEARRLAEAQRIAAERLRQVAEAQERVVIRTRLGAVVALVLALVAVGFGWWGSDRAQEADAQRQIAVERAGEAESQRQEAERERQAATERLRQAQVNESRYLAFEVPEEVQRGNVDLAIGLALFALPDDLEAQSPSRPLVPSAVTALYEARRADRAVGALWGHSHVLTSANFSPDGRRVVTASADSTARLWDAATGASVAIMGGHSDRVDSATFSPDGARLVTASGDGTARLWDAESGADIMALEGHEGPVTSASFSPDGGLVITASSDGTARLWDTASGAAVTELKGHTSGVNSAAFSPDAARIVTASDDNTVRLWDASSGTSIGEPMRHEGWVWSAAFSPNGARIVTGSWDTTAHLWEGSTGASIAVLAGHSEAVTLVAFSPEGSRVVTASDDQTARLWDGATGTPIAVLKGHSEYVRFAAFSPDATRLVTASWDGTARLWEAETGASIAVLAGHSSAVLYAGFSPDGTHVVTASQDGSARLWDLGTGMPTTMLVGHSRSVNSASFSPDGALVVTSSDDRTARLWDNATGAQMTVLEGHRISTTSAAFSPDGARVVTASGDWKARLWEVESGVSIAVLEGHSEPLTSAVFSPDGARVVTASWDGTARVWDAGTGAPIAVLQRVDSGGITSAVLSSDGALILMATTEGNAWLRDAATGAVLSKLEGHLGPVNSAVFSPDGARVVTASWDGTARLWREPGSLLRVLAGHSEPVTSAAFSSDGMQVVTSSRDRTARIWDAATGAMVAVLDGHTGGVLSAAFSPDGTRVVTASQDSTARIWNVAPSLAVAHPLALAAQFRSLSVEERRRFDLADSGVLKETVSPYATQCDLLATHDFDPQALAPGVAFALLNAEAAISVCEAALEDLPDEARYRFLLGRALDKAGRHEEAVVAHRAAADAGYPMALHNLGEMLRDGRGVERGDAEARDLYARALQLGVSVAGAPLGWLYWHGEGGDQNRTRAVEIWREAAAMGDPYSQEHLGWVAELGRDGTPAGPALALYHYAVAVRLYEQHGLEEEAVGPRYRRGTLARLLEPAIVAAKWREAMALGPVPSQP